MVCALLPQQEIVADAVGAASPQSAAHPLSAPEAPCAAAINLVSAAMGAEKFAAQRRAWAQVGAQGWPLFEAELKLNLKDSELSGRLRILQAAGDSAGVTLSMPVESGSEASLYSVTLTSRGALGEEGGAAATKATRSEGSEGALLALDAVKSEAPILTELELFAALPSLGPPAILDSLAAINPRAQLGLVGRGVVHARGMTLLPALPGLVERSQLARGPKALAAPMPFGPALPLRPSCVLLKLRHPSGTSLQTSGLEIGRVRVDSGELVTTVVGVGMRQFGLVLTQDRARESVSATFGGLHIRASAGTKGAARKLLDDAKQGLLAYARELAPYPFLSLEIASLPLFGGVDGLHATGLIVVNELFEAQKGPLAGFSSLGGEELSRLQSFALLHELAHQWSGEWVATPGPRAPALEELLASQALRKISSSFDREGEGGMGSEEIMARLYRNFRLAGGEDAPADVSLNLLGYAGYVGLVLGKAGLTLAALEQQLGVKRVAKRVRALLKRRAYRTMTRSDLSAALCLPPEKEQRACQTLLQRFLDQRHGDEDLEALVPHKSRRGNMSLGELGDPQMDELLRTLMQSLQGSP